MSDRANPAIPARKELSEDAAARDPETGVCSVCACGPGQDHDRHDHDSWEAAEDGTWD